MTWNANETEIEHAECRATDLGETYYDLAVSFAKLAVHPGVPRELRGDYARLSDFFDRKCLETDSAAIINVPMSLGEFERWRATRMQEDLEAA